MNREGFLNQPPLVAISIQDNGPGIPPEVLAKMFETKFTTKSADKGTGLGLSIVKRLVKTAQGAIHLQTVLGKGSTFTVCLPVAAGLRHPSSSLLEVWAMIEDLVGLLGEGRVLWEQEHLLAYGFDGTAALRQMPGCVVLPGDGRKRWRKWCGTRPGRELRW